MSVINNNLLMTPEGYQISRSVRLRSSAGGYFNRTPASAGNRKTWTWSGWVKRGAIGARGVLFGDTSGTTDSTFGFMGFTAADKFEYSGYTTQFRTSTQVFRDPSAWYHIVMVMDTTQATASNRFRVYVNGVEITAWDTNNAFTQNTDYTVNQNTAHYISGIYNLDCYLTEINFVDGQALTPSSFGETDAVTGVWKPKKYAGTYGTNGFYLNFSDNSNNTVATIGKDYSGNGNNWTPNNISVTAGVTYDSMLDTPTPYADGGNGRGNYAVLNPIAPASSYRVAPQQGNLYAAPDSTNSFCYATMTVPLSGKWYWEVSMSQSATYGMALGITAAFGTTSATWPANDYSYYNATGQKHSNAGLATYGSSWSTGGTTYVLGVALDMDTGQLTFYLNGVSQGVAYTVSTTTEWIPYSIHTSGTGSSLHIWNFGQRPFAYTPPTGFKALNTQNLPDSTIKKGNAYFDATTYTGTGATLTVTNTASMQPDFVWLKGRSGATDHALYDSVRGVQLDLVSNSTAAETTQSTGLTAFASNGFTIGSLAKVNTSSATYVGWQWKKGAAQGFDIVTYTGTGSGNITVNHSLGVTPAMWIIKDRTLTSTDWLIGHKSLSANYYLLFNTNAASNASTPFVSQSSSNIVLSGSQNLAQNYVAYLFSEVAGFSKFGSYTGNGSTDGPFVYCGFRPRWLMVKRTDTTSNWELFDTARDQYNVAVNYIYPNLSNAESPGTGPFDFVSNGFKLRFTHANHNASGGTYIFAVFAENPFKNSLAR